MKKVVSLLLVLALSIALLAGCAGKTDESKTVSSVAGSSAVVSEVAPLTLTLAGEEDTPGGFFCVINEQGDIYWKAGLNGFDDVYKEFGLTDDGTYACVFAIPDNGEEHPYLYPEGDWKILIYGNEIPAWMTGEHQDAVTAAFSDWKEEVYSLFDYEGLRELSFEQYMANVPADDYKMTDEDYAMMKEFINIDTSLITFPRDSFKNTVAKYCGQSILNDIWSFVSPIGNDIKEAAISTQRQSDNGVMARGVTSTSFIACVAGGFFNIDDWMYYDGNTDGYPYESSVYLYEHGMFVWIDDGTTNWYLSTGNGIDLHKEKHSEISPAQAFTCLLDSDGNVYWKAALDCVADLEQEFKSEISSDYIGVHIKPVLDESKATIELPDGKDPSIMHNYAYYDPASVWTLTADAEMDWFSSEYEQKVWDAYNTWRSEVYDSIDFEGIRSVFSKELGEITYTDEDVELLRTWAEIRSGYEAADMKAASEILKIVYDTVGISLWTDASEYITADWRVHHTCCTGMAVEKAYMAYKGYDDNDKTHKTEISEIPDSVSDMQTALTAGFISGIDWGNDDAAYAYSCVSLLVNKGLIPCTDGINWYFCNMDTAELIFEISEAELLAK